VAENILFVSGRVSLSLPVPVPVPLVLPPSELSDYMQISGHCLSGAKLMY